MNGPHDERRRGKASSHRLIQPYPLSLGLVSGHFTLIIFGGNLLAATREEFALDDDCWIERLLFRSQLLAPNESPNS